MSGATASLVLLFREVFSALGLRIFALLSHLVLRPAADRSPTATRRPAYSLSSPPEGTDGSTVIDLTVELRRDRPADQDHRRHENHPDGEPATTP